MRRNLQLAPTRRLAIFGPLMAGLLFCGFSGAASAIMVGTVSIDGIRSAGEYSGASSGSKTLLWFNDHESIYTEAAKNMNTMHWEINGAGSDWSLALFVEVPTYARRMVWAEDCKYKPGSPDAADCGDIPTDILDAYYEGSHHKDVNMSYKTQTGSEYFKLNGPDICFGLQDDGGNCKDATVYQNPVDDVTKNDGIFWQTSRHWVLDNGCSTNQCLMFDTSMSLELLFRGLATMDEAMAKVAGVTSLQLHLSDEARGLPPIPEVPVPAAVWLFGTALIGFIGYSRKARAS